MFSDLDIQTRDSESQLSFSDLSQFDQIQCSYCQETRQHFLIQCDDESCGKYFCNSGKIKETQSSHILAHLQISEHRRLVVFSNIKKDKQLLQCDICGSSNCFSLGYIEGIQSKLICRVPCFVSKNLSDKKWKPLISKKNVQLIGKSMITKHVKGNIITQNDQKCFEAENQVSENYHGCEEYRIKKAYKTFNEYLETFNHLLMLEEDSEALANKKSFFPDVRIYYPFEENNVEFPDRTVVYFFGDEIGCKFGNRDQISLLCKESEWSGKAKLENKIFGKWYLKIDNAPHSLVRFVTMHLVDDNNFMPEIIKKLKKVGELGFNKDILNVALGKTTEAKMEYFEENNEYLVKGMPKLNESQRKAVENALKYKFSIIQGPPGTGKTQTLAALVYQINKLCQEKENNNNNDDQIEYAQQIVKRIEKLKASNIPPNPRTLKNIEYYESKLFHYKFASKSPIDSKSHLKSQNYQKADKILICAPSNVPVTGIRERLQKCNIKALQIFARSRQAENAAIPDTLYYEANQILSENQDYKKTIEKISNLEKQKKENTPQYEKLSNKVYLMRIKAEKVVISRYNVICCTCMTTNLAVLKDIKFQHVIIDEATQALEPEILMCLGKGALQAILIGDTMQLGSVIKSTAAKSLGLDVPMIQRLGEIGVPMQTLLEQHRMSPEIAEFSNISFYQGRIKNSSKTLELASINIAKNVKSHLMFYNIEAKEETSGSGNSYVNRSEAEAIAKIINHLQNQGVKSQDIGIITFYDGQRGYLSHLISQRCKKTYVENIEIMSVDAAQGREWGIIILSCVRANEKASVGFLNEFRRLNVAVTRAKYELIVCGNLNTLSESPFWARFIKYFSDKKLIFSGNFNRLKRKNVKIDTSKNTGELTVSKYQAD